MHSQSFHSQLHSLYPDASDPFFSHAEPQQQSAHQPKESTQHQSKLTSPKRSAKDDKVEEHKYPEPAPSSAPQTKEHAIIQPHRQQSDLLAHPQEAQHLQPHSLDPFDMFGDMDRVFDAQMQRMGRMMERFGGASLLGGMPSLADLPALGSTGGDGATYSYSSSSSSYSAGDGSAQPFYRHAAHTTQSVNGVSSSRSRYSDSLGNARETRGWGLGQQQREVCIDRNAKGEERQRENLKELQPEQVDEFTRQWEQRRQEVDPKHRLIRDEEAQSGNSRRAIKPTENSARKQVTA